MTYREEKHQSLSTPSPVFMSVLITSSADDFLPRLVRWSKEEPCPPSCPRDPNRVKCAFYFSKIIPKFIRSRFVHSFISIIDINKSGQLILTLNNNLEVIVKDFFKIFER